MANLRNKPFLSGLKKKNKTVGHLRRAIKEGKQNDFANIDANEFTFWRVYIPLDNADTVLGDLVLENSYENGIQNLNPLYKIEQVFPEEPADLHIHVIVQPPVTG